MGRINHFTFKRVANTFFLHNMNIEWFYQQSDFLSGFKTMIILYHELVSFGSLHHHFVMDSFKDGRSNRSGQHGSFRRVEYINIFRTDYDIDRCLFSETFIDTFKIVSGKRDLLIFYHQSVQDITFTNEVGYKRVDRFVIDIDRGSYLLDTAFAHHDNRIAQR